MNEAGAEHLADQTTGSAGQDLEKGAQQGTIPSGFTAFVHRVMAAQEQI